MTADKAASNKLACNMLPLRWQCFAIESSAVRSPGEVRDFLTSKPDPAVLLSSARMAKKDPCVH